MFTNELWYELEHPRSFLPQILTLNKTLQMVRSWPAQEKETEGGGEYTATLLRMEKRCNKRGGVGKKKEYGKFYNRPEYQKLPTGEDFAFYSSTFFTVWFSLYIYKNTSKRRNKYDSKSAFVSCMIQKHIVDNSMLKCVQNPKKTVKNNLATFQPKAFELNLQ